jgi:methylase of polypeptide subunit release factors
LRDIGRKPIKQAPESWRSSCANSECTLHQLSPYIGKLKSSIARDLILAYSDPGDLVADTFSGSGTIPLEALLNGRNVFASDINPYSKILTKGKLFAPPNVEVAVSTAKKLIIRSRKAPTPDLRKVPKWVRSFFHPRTLKDAINFSIIAKQPGYEFFFACFLGILHHQRPGFLSYPSSHLVPYLRNKKFPQKQYPQLYNYRELEPRLIAKIKRAYRRYNSPSNSNAIFRKSSIKYLTLPLKIDCLITSPPYMNALDYERDNRLRLWFIDPHRRVYGDNSTNRKSFFLSAMSDLSKKLKQSLKPAGYCILIIGEEVRRGFKAHPSEIVEKIFADSGPSLRLINSFTDKIPDIRRARRDCRGIKTERFLIFQRLQDES